MTRPSAVAETPAADSADALDHFLRRLSFETDCWDTHDALSQGASDFVLLDVRSPALYAEGHVPGALNLPHGKMTERRMADWPADTLFVVYCAGPHCNGANKAAVRLARMGHPVKEMIGGVTGWLDEGFLLAKGDAPSSVTEVEAGQVA
ncbi:rhodanese-like domain-containing protein [Citreimonas sp.]|uniref:rhodanese-like domain-containing protein n=1 Tax=Citreimonas sp. TaxID=3036715 RepID=UPI004059C1CA